MQTEDAIGVVRAHRWATLEDQRAKLKADGCRVIVDLGDKPRDTLVPLIRESTVLKLVYAFLLAEPRGARAALADYRAFACRLAKLPRKCVGIVKDLDTGLVAATPGARKAMLAVVKEQLTRHGKGKQSAENGKRGRARLVLTELQDAKGEAIWRNVALFPEWKDAEAELRAKVHKGLTRWQAHRRWGPRRIGGKETGR